MSPVSRPVLGAAALISAPVLWRALVLGTAPLQTALERFLVSAAVCWVAFELLAMLVGPAPRRPRSLQPEQPAAPAPADGGAETREPVETGDDARR